MNWIHIRDTPRRPADRLDLKRGVREINEVKVSAKSDDQLLREEGV
jgi:hypothetical protein